MLFHLCLCRCRVLILFLHYDISKRVKVIVFFTQVKAEIYNKQSESVNNFQTYKSKIL